MLYLKSASSFGIFSSMKVDLKSLSNLAKIKIDENELNELESDMEAILSFVKKVQELDLDLEPNAGDWRNVFRNDEVEPFGNTQELVKASSNASPDGKYILVKKVIKK